MSETGGIPPSPQKQNTLINLAAMDAQTREWFDNLDDEAQANYLGFNGRPRPNIDVPAFNKLSHELVLGGAEQGAGNAWITLGLDRNAGEATGFGGQIATHCAAIDLVAGRKAWFATSKTKRSRRDIIVENDFTIDAARVYITQKSDIDGYFRLKPGKVGNTSMEDPRSAVALKADNIRVIARENIKLVTGTDKQNSQGGLCSKAITKQYGIDIMAMNDEVSLQPMVKGTNLAYLLENIIDMISQLTSTFGTYVSETRKLHTSIMKHTHMSPFYANLTAPDFQSTLPQGINTLINNITNVDVGNMTTQMAFNQLKMEYGISTSNPAETLDSETNRTRSILSPYNSNN